MTTPAAKVREMQAKNAWAHKGKHGREHISKKYRIAINKMTVDGVLGWVYLAFVKADKKWKPLDVFNTPEEARKCCMEHMKI